MVDIACLQKKASAHNKTLSWNWIHLMPATTYGDMWERKIGSLKSVLNATLKLMGKYHASREELAILLQFLYYNVN